MNKLFELLEAERPIIPDSNADYYIGYNNGLVMAQAIVLKRDIEEVVRCEKCKHWDTENCSEGQGWCPKVVGYRYGRWYCAAGERRDNA